MMTTPCYYCEENRDYACKVCIHHYKGPTVEELNNQADRIFELETSVREWSDKAMEFSNLASRYEEELAALRQQQGEPVAEIGWAAGVEGGITEVIGLTDSFYDLPVGTKLYREAAPKQQGEPFGWYWWDEKTGEDGILLHSDNISEEQKKQWKPLYCEAAPRVPEECEWRCAPIGTIIKRASSVQFIFDQLDTVADGDYRFFIEAAPEPK